MFFSLSENLCFWWGDCVLKTPFFVINNNPDITDMAMNIVCWVMLKP